CGEVCPHCNAWRGELGMEPEPQLFIAHLVETFDALRRVLRDDGVLWVNLGDSAAAGGNGGGGKSIVQPGHWRKGWRSAGRGLKALDKSGIPESFVLAMRDAGWYWRQTIVWSKVNCMPESVNGCRWQRCRRKVRSGSVSRHGVNGSGREPHSGSIANKRYKANTPDRNGKSNRDCVGVVWQGGAKWVECSGCEKCKPNGGYVLRRGAWRPTTSHEYIFQFAKSKRYWANAEASKEPHGYNRWGDARHQNAAVVEGVYGDGDVGQSSVLRSGAINSFPAGGRNPRSVWRIGSEPFKGPHYAACPS